MRYEDQNQNKKYFYPYIGEGLRYEIKDFASAILSNDHSCFKLSQKDVIAMSKVQELFQNGFNLYKL